MRLPGGVLALRSLPLAGAPTDKRWGSSSRRLRFPFEASPLSRHDSWTRTRRFLRELPFLPRFLPLRRLSSLKEPLNPNEDASSSVTLHSQGFAPSQRFAPPETSQAYFILVPSMGFPLQRSDQNPKSYALSNAAALLTFSPTLNDPRLRASPYVRWTVPTLRRRLQGLAPRTLFQLVHQGLAGNPSGSLSWGFLPQGMKRVARRDPFRVTSPPVLSRLTSKPVWRRHPRVYTSYARNRPLSRSISPREVCYLVNPISTLWRARRAGRIDYPQISPNVATGLQI